MEVRFGLPASLEIALEPGELALYVRYGLLPAMVAGGRTIAVDSFRVPLLYRVDAETMMGILNLDWLQGPQACRDDHTASEEWAMLVIELREALSTARERHGSVYRISAAAAIPPPNAADVA